MSALADMGFAIAALCFVLVLAWLAIRLLARYGIGARGATPGRRVQVVQSLPIGQRERLLLIRCDSREYLLITTPHAATVIDRLGKAAAEQSPAIAQDVGSKTADTAVD